MSEAKEKDCILAQIKEFKPHSEIVGLEKHLDALIKDEYVSGGFATDGSVIVVRITPKGKRFLENGGYSAMERKSKAPVARLRPMRKELRGVIWAVIAGLIVAYLSKRLGWM